MSHALKTIYSCQSDYKNDQRHISHTGDLVAEREYDIISCGKLLKETIFPGAEHHCGIYWKSKYRCNCMCCCDLGASKWMVPCTTVCAIIFVREMPIYFFDFYDFIRHPEGTLIKQRIFRPDSNLFSTKYVSAFKKLRESIGLCTKYVSTDWRERICESIRKSGICTCDCSCLYLCSIWSDSKNRYKERRTTWRYLIL